MKKRLDYLDMVKGIGIFFVVLGHMEDISGGMRIWISSFHMPLFFIVSGLLMAVKKEDDNDFRQVVAKKWKGIMVPYLWFSLSYFVIDILNVTVIGNIDTHTFIVDTISSLTFYGMSVLWFLPALFLASISFLFINSRLSSKITPIALIIISVVSYVIKLQLANVYDENSESLLITSIINVIYIVLRAAVALSFVGYAFYIRRLYERFVLEKRKCQFIENKIIAIIIGVAMLIINISLAMVNNCVDLRNIILNNVPIYFVSAFMGCYGIILILKSLPPIKLITYFGKNSLIVMADHVNYYFLYAGLRLAWIIVPFVNHAKHYVLVFIVVATVLVLSAIVIEVINRWFPFVIGKGSIKDLFKKKALR